jgi:hypothetical protein
LNVIQSQITGICIDGKKRQTILTNTCLFGEKLDLISQFGFGGLDANYKNMHSHYEIFPRIHISKDKEPKTDDAMSLQNANEY